MLIHLLLHSWKKSEATVGGHKLKEVVCDHCQTSFWYFLSRYATGESSSFVLARDTKARQRASASANENLERRLDREIDPVPCPTCHHINEELVRRVRKRRYRAIPIWSLVLLMLGGIVFFAVNAIAEDNARIRSNRPFILAIEASAIFAIVAVALFPLRTFLRGRFNPNAFFPQPPTLEPGTPPAMVPVAGRLTLVPVKYAIKGESVKWAFRRADQNTLPNICCHCLCETDDVYRAALANNGFLGHAIPLCPECRKLVRKFQVLLGLLTAVVVVALVGSAFLRSGDRNGEQSALHFFLAVLAILIGIYVTAKCSCPYRIQIVDADRGVTRIESRNLGYAPLLKEYFGELDHRQIAPPGLNGGGRP